MKEPISWRVEGEIKETLEHESTLRGHTISDAMEQITKIGLPLYLKRFPKKFVPVEEQERMRA